MKNNYSLNYYFSSKWFYATFSGFFLLLMASYFLFKNTSNIGEILNFYFGLAFFGLLLSHDLLKNNQVFTKYFLASIIMLLFISFCERPFFAYQIGYATFISKSIILFLVFQKAFRFLFLKLTNREPDFSMYAPKSFVDFVYTLLLVAGSIILPIAFIAN
jgi:hypothetical protein